MKQAIRHKKIIHIVNQNGYVSTEELVAMLEVSSQTIRRDLNELAENNLIRRHHGGAASPSSSENSDYQSRKSFFSLQKELIGKRVANFIPNGASLFIDIGTTAEAVAYALLQHQNLRIVTNNLNVAHLFMHKTHFEVTVAGGQLRQDGGIIGEPTVHLISQYRLDFGVLGISSIDQKGTLLDYDYHEVQVKRAILDNSRVRMLVTDHSKFSRNAVVRLGTLTDIDYLFTDMLLPSELQEQVEMSSLHLEICQN